MTAKALMDLPAANVFGNPLSSPEGQEYAKNERRPKLAESIKKHGVTDEVIVEHELGYPMLVEGHHRVIEAHGIDPEMQVPVVHWDQT